MKRRMVRMVAGAVCAAATVFFAAAGRPTVKASPAFARLTPAPAQLHVVARHAIPGDGLSVHSATAITDGPSGLLAAWFEGSKEAAGDVAIRMSRYDGKDWTAPRIILTRDMVSVRLGHLTKVLGNPVLHRDSAGRVHLFTVCVTYGGWATGHIVHLVSTDNGETFVPREILPLSPFLNVSHLVRASALDLDDGGFILPAYFEMGAKYPVLLRFDGEGRLESRERVRGAANLIQPSIAVPPDGQAPMMILRDAGTGYHRVFASHLGADGTWQPPVATSFPNPNASVAILAAEDGGSWLAINPSETGRTHLVLQKADADLKAQDVLDIAAHDDGGEASYPALVHTLDGRVHLLYTDARHSIGHVVLEAGRG